jgi:hypothetical protein
MRIEEAPGVRAIINDTPPTENKFDYPQPKRTSRRGFLKAAGVLATIAAAGIGLGKLISANGDPVPSKSELPFTSADPSERHSPALKATLTTIKEKSAEKYDAIYAESRDKVDEIKEGLTPSITVNATPYVPETSNTTDQNVSNSFDGLTPRK